MISAFRCVPPGTLVRRATAFCLLVMLPLATFAAEQVTVDNFVRAETDMTFKRYSALGGFGKFLHIRNMTPIDKQDVVRMNRDTLYSAGVFDLTQPVTIVKPDPGKRFQSMLVINQDHSMQPVQYGPGSFTLTREKVGTRYVMVLFRTFADPADAADMAAARTLQDGIEAKQSSPGQLEVPDWDGKSLTTIRDALKVLAATANLDNCFGDKAKLNPISHLLCTAYGWGGNPRKDAVYVSVVPKQNDGSAPYVLNVRDVPVDGFWSITVYNSKGYMEKNALDAYSVNGVTAKPNADGSYTVHFGGDPKAVNFLPITAGWSYTVRMYRPQAAVFSGKWTFPEARSAK